jgi:hypothetical protein
VSGFGTDAAWQRWLPPALALLFVLSLAGLWWFEGLRGGQLVHAACMITAWAGMLPAGAILARWWKVAPRQRFPEVRDNPLWWNWHRGLQCGGVALATLGLLAILTETGGRLGGAHAMLGGGAMLLGWAQVLGAQFRGTKGGRQTRAPWRRTRPPGAAFASAYSSRPSSTCATAASSATTCS